MAGSLPADVLIELFRQLPPQNQYWDRFGILDVAGVNKTWRIAAFGCGTLWSTIHTEWRRHRRLMPLFLERSGAAPLDVRLGLFCSEYGNPPSDTTPQERAAVVQALLPHAHRIQKLYIRHRTLEAESEDAVTILQLVDAGLEFPLLTEYIHERKGPDFQPDAEDDTPLDFTAPNLLTLSVNGTRPRAWPTLLAPLLVELEIISKGTPLDMNLLATIFGQCRALTFLKLRKGFYHTHAPLVYPGPHQRFIPPPSLRALDLYMPMPEILAVLDLIPHGAILDSITVCDGEGLRKIMLTATEPQPLLPYMLRGLAPLTALRCTMTRTSSCAMPRAARGASESTRRTTSATRLVNYGPSSSRSTTRTARCARSSGRQARGISSLGPWSVGSRSRPQAALSSCRSPWSATARTFRGCAIRDTFDPCTSPR